MNIDVAVSKLQECIDKRDSAETIKVLKQSRRVFYRTKFHLQVAEQAAERIDIRCVVPVLDTILKQLEVKPRVIAKVMVFFILQSSIVLFSWLHAILYHHCTYLSTVPELKHKLDYLHKLLNMRGETYARLLKLQGRLDLFSELSHGDISKEIEEVEMDTKEEELSELYESAESDSE